MWIGFDIYMAISVTLGFFAGLLVICVAERLRCPRD